MPSTSPDLFQKKLLDEKIANDPCAAGPDLNAFYQCGISMVHKDLVPRHGQCLPPTPPSKKEELT